MAANDSFKKSILKSDLSSVFETAGEISVDSLLDEGLVKEIPILKTVLAIGNTYKSITDYFFARKMLLFLQSISKLSAAERTRLIEKIDEDANFGSYAGERIIELLSRIDGEIKPKLVAKALKLYANEKITSQQLQRINHAIERFLLCDADALRSFCAGPKPLMNDENPISANLISSGLAFVQSGYGGGGVHPTETADLFVKVLNEVEI